MKKGNKLRCLDIPRVTPLEQGFAIYPGEFYIADSDPYDWQGTQVIDLVENGDYEPSTTYAIKFFEAIE